MIQTEEDAIKLLREFGDQLSKIKRASSNGVNIFDAVGMNTQEIKHSAFLAWLLDPKETHNLGSAFLSDILRAVVEYDSGDSHGIVQPNRKILKDISNEDIYRLVNAKDTVVITEKVVNDPASRIDIFIQSKTAELTVVIENKVFTSTHDDQLSRYEKEVSIFVGKKIYVYLTPNGDMPTDIDGNYQENWCVLSYKTILDVLKKRYAMIPKTKNNSRTLFLMEDYINMVNTNLLKGNENIRAVCKELKRKYADALEILAAYTDNVDMVYEYIGQEWLPNNVDNIANKYFNGRRLYFCTQPIVDYYSRHGRRIEIDPTRYVFQISVISKDGPISIIMGLNKNVDEEWRAEDIAVRDILMSDKKMGDKYCTLHSVLLLSEEDREKNFDEVKTTVDEKLKAFFAKVKELERELDRR